MKAKKMPKGYIPVSKKSVEPTKRGRGRPKKIESAELRAPSKVKKPVPFKMSESPCTTQLALNQVTLFSDMHEVSSEVAKMADAFAEVISHMNKINSELAIKLTAVEKRVSEVEKLHVEETPRNEVQQLLEN